MCMNAFGTDSVEKLRFVTVALCLLLAGCTISITNSPDWCNGNPGNVICK